MKRGSSSHCVGPSVSSKLYARWVKNGQERKGKNLQGFSKASGEGRRGKQQQKEGISRKFPSYASAERKKVAG